MSNIIDTIQVSGVTYTIAGSGSGNSVVEVTQAQYDALVSGGTVDPTILYIITDAQAGDLTQYWTSAQTQSAITEATSGKVDTSDFNTYSASVETALSGKQDTLVSGTNIKTINNESLLGSGNITIQGGGGSITVDDMLSSTSTNPVQNKVVKSATDRICKLFGYGTSGQTDILAWATGATSAVIDDYVQFSKINGKKIIGNGVSPTDNFSLVETSAITSSITSSSTDAQVPSAKAVYDAIPTTTSAVTSGSTAVVESGAVYSQLGGLKLVKLTQAEYDNLSTKDSNTLYIVTDS